MILFSRPSRLYLNLLSKPAYSLYLSSTEQTVGGAAWAHPGLNHPAQQPLNGVWGAGHMTVAVHRSETATRAMPPWTTVQADVDLVCKLHERLSDVYDVSKLDVVVVGIFHQV